MNLLVVERDRSIVIFGDGRRVELPRARTDPVKKTVATISGLIVIDAVRVDLGPGKGRPAPSTGSPGARPP